MINGYFWNGTEVLTWEGGMEAEVFRGIGIHLQNRPCVDVTANSSRPDQRYGIYDDCGWAPVPLKSFSKEFQMHLLLLGVS